MASRKEQVMQSVRSELALANAQELMNSANKACFQKCITKPGGSLSSSEETCLDRCLGRYMDACAWSTFCPLRGTDPFPFLPVAVNIVASTYVTRLKRDRQEHAASGDVLSA